MNASRTIASRFTIGDTDHDLLERFLREGQALTEEQAVELARGG